MDNEYYSDTFIMVLKNKDLDKNGEFEITFNKPIHIREDLEVALTEITIPNNIWTNNSLEPKAINKSEIKNIVDILFVYSNIVKESYVGNTKSNILRVFPVNKIDKNIIISYRFEHPFYIPLRVNEIISIKISIRDSLSNILLYDEGDITLTLLFRPKEHI